MKTRTCFAVFFIVSFISLATSRAKDDPIELSNCPAPVQATIKQYSARGTLEGIAVDQRKKAGGPAVYEAKFSLTDGKRIEVHISAAGQVILVEDKKAK